jgi:hypothetical protein
VLAGVLVLLALALVAGSVLQDAKVIAKTTADNKTNFFIIGNF